MKKDEQVNQDSGNLNPKEASQNSRSQGSADVNGDRAARTVSTVGHVKSKEVSDSDIADAAPSGQSDIDPK